MIKFNQSAWLAIVAATSLAQLAGCDEPKSEKKATVAQPAKPAASATPAAMAKKEAPQPLTGEEVATWYGKCWDLFNSKKWDEFSKCYAEDAVATRGSDPAYTLKGRAQIVEQNAKPFAAGFPDVKGERQLTLVNGNHVTSIALIQGTHTGTLVDPSGNIPATNKKIGQMMMHWLEVNAAGQAAKQWEVSDSPTLMAQLGLSKDPARAALTTGFAKQELVIAKNDEAEAKNVAAHKKAYELFNKHDIAMFELLADDVVERNYSSPADVSGKKALSAMNQAFWKGFSDISVATDEAWGAGNYTFILGRMTGTNDGDMPAMGLKKTGKKIDMRFGEIVQWADGKAKISYPFWDNMEMAAQLGLLPPPKDEGKAPAAAAGAASAAAPAAAAPAKK